MNYRKALLFPPKDVGVSGTEVIPIRLNEIISRISIKFKTTKGEDAMDAPGPATIPKIELIDGSKHLHNLSGYQNQALAYHNHPGIQMDHGQYLTANAQVDLFQIDFGRWLWDTELAFDPKRFENLQLRIQYLETASDSEVSANELEVWADIFDEKLISPLGFLSALEHYDYTPSADNSFEVIAMPMDRPYRQILVRAYQDGETPWTQIDEARFDEGTLDKIPWEYTSLETYFRMRKASLPPIRTQGVYNLATSVRTFYIPQTDYWATVMLCGHSDAQVPSFAASAHKGGKLSLIGEYAGEYTGLTSGYLPWHCYQFPMGLKDVIDDWYDPAGKKPRLRLRSGSGGPSGNVQVVIEELYRY